jgi:hypothetical protein
LESSSSNILKWCAVIDDIGRPANVTVFRFRFTACYPSVRAATPVLDDAPDLTVCYGFPKWRGLFG